MNLPTYPRLNLPTKRLGIMVFDWFWIAAMVLPGLVFGSIVLVALLPFLGYLYAKGVKARKPKGWTSAKLRFLFSQKKNLAGLEINAYRNLLSDKHLRN